MIRCSPVNDVPDAATESVDDVGDVDHASVATSVVTSASATSVTGRSVSDASPKYNIGLRPVLYFGNAVVGDVGGSVERVLRSA
ncbi:unnamed protein product [Heligmosomoides polygyrus]|uniref:Thioredoxin reductase n=1 Tax=Heligmosomoides polygyrus TaxID=6339 RepID=A0A183G4H2_HELPZ|nr:unnamed protein product [Heligmosomoides polygyrus]